MPVTSPSSAMIAIGDSSPAAATDVRQVGTASGNKTDFRFIRQSLPIRLIYQLYRGSRLVADLLAELVIKGRQSLGVSIKVISTPGN